MQSLNLDICVFVRGDGLLETTSLLLNRDKVFVHTLSQTLLLWDFKVFFVDLEPAFSFLFFCNLIGGFFFFCSHRTQIKVALVPSLGLEV